MERTPCAIVHDFANVLMVIRGTAELLKLHIGPEHAAASDIDELIRAADEAGALNAELRAMACTDVTVV